MFAKKLELNDYIINLEDRFKNTVIKNFAESYKIGETPIPCIRCNQMQNLVTSQTLQDPLIANTLLQDITTKKRII